MEGNVDISQLKSRKVEHILISVERGVESRATTLLEEVRIVHNPLPQVDLDEVSLETEFCGKRVGAPLMITGMTGGHPRTAEINRLLGRLAGELGLPIGVGSQRAAIEDPSLEYTFRVMREEAPGAFIVANIGAPQLSKGYGPREAARAVEMIQADALAIHLNPAQELYQEGGDPYYSGVVEKIVEILDYLDVPVIVKETGAGLSREAVRTLYRLGVRCFDVSGLGGTSWVKVEALRSRSPDYLHPGPLADYWGNPTALAIVEARTAAPGAYIVGSGGIRSGLDAARALALGADLAGMALPVLRVLARSGLEAARRYVEQVLYSIRAAIMLVGGRRPSDLWRAPIVLGPRLRGELEQRGVDYHSYILRGRLVPLTVVRWPSTRSSRPS